MHLMRQRKTLSYEAIHRRESFNTEIGMAFSTRNDPDGGPGEPRRFDQVDDEIEEEEEEGGAGGDGILSSGHRTASNKFGMSTTEGQLVLETEKGIKA